MYVAMTTRAPKATARRRSRIPRPGDEAGFGLIEVIASAAVFAFLALGVLAGIDGAAGSAGREKARAVASALAERDQERMRAMRAIDLPEYRHTEQTEVGGTKYTVVSEADWVSDSNGATVSCTSNGGKADYLRLRTTVTSPTVGTRTAPVRIDSLVAPPIGSSGGNNGTLTVQVANRDGAPVVDLPVAIAGDTTLKTFSEVTNAVGCAVFAYIPADEYDVTVDQAGWVSPDGVQKVVVPGTVTAGNTTVTPLLYDRKSSLTATFSTSFWDPVTQAVSTRASRGWALTLANDDMKVDGGERTYAATNGSPQASFTAANLFPFKDGYGVYSGRCTEQNPSQFDDPWAVGGAFKLLDPGVAATMDVRQPALPVRVSSGTVASGTHKGKPNWLGDARVQAKLVGLETDSACAAVPDALKSIEQDATGGLQSYPAGIAGYSGTSATNYADGRLGFVTKAPATSPWTSGYFDPGMPWGVWQVCAETTVGGTTWRNFVTVTNQDPNGSSAYTQLNVLGTGAQRAKCSAGSWPAA